MAINLGFNYPQVAREAGFKIRKCNDGPMDWRILGSIEIEQILEEQDLHKIDNILYHLSETPLGSVLESNILEYSIIKYFLVSQFAIQYLLFCRTFLEETLTDIKEAHTEAQTEIVRLKKSLAESNNESFRLNKRIAEIEKIREVVYPCHLCSKNFVSNESLNIHIGRRHPASGDRSVSSEKRSETSSIQRERERDLTLINTIKLELEIKQLKERLNAAEKEIKERSTLSSKHTTPRDFTKKNTSDIGIQNDLDESKEQDDCIVLESSVAKIKSETLQQLSNKVHEFEIWRDKLRTDYEKFIIDINKKFELLAKTLEENHNPQYKPENSMEQIIVNPIEELEALLIQKVTEIGVSSAKKLEEVVDRMEENYKLKLLELEKEIKNRNIESSKIKGIDSNSSISKNISKKVSSDTFTITEHESVFKSSLEKSTPLAKHSNATTETFSSTDPNLNIQASYQKDLGSCKEAFNGPFPQSQVPLTHIEDAKVDTPQMEIESYITKVQDTSLLIQKTENKTHEWYDKTCDSRLSPHTHKGYSRIGAKILANKELRKHGVNLQTKIMSRSRMKRVSTQLADKRILLKEKYPHIYEVRNKMKRFVEQLCASELPDHAQSFVNSIRTCSLTDNIYQSIHHKEEISENVLKFDSNDVNHPASPTSYAKENSWDDKPSTSAEALLNAKTNLKMVPVARKKVMFNTPYIAENDEKK